MQATDLDPGRTGCTRKNLGRSGHPSQCAITHALLAQVRRAEVDSMARAALIKTFNLCLVFAVPPVIFLMVAATYVFAFQPLDAVFAFTVVRACMCARAWMCYIFTYACVCM